MKRSFILGLVLAAVLGGGPARAAVTTSTVVQQNFVVNAGLYHPNGYKAVYLNLIIEAGAASVGTAVTPGLRFEAGGYVQDCDIMWNCSAWQFSPQTVNPTAFSMDPAGNSGTFRACLLPTSGPCRQFDLVMTRPGYVGTACMGVCVYPNAWYDPTTSTAGGNAFAIAGVSRQGYIVSGVAAGGAPLVFLYSMSTYFFGLVNQDAIT